MRRVVRKLENHVDDQNRQDFLEWMSPGEHTAEHTSKHTSILGLRQAGTGAWVLDREEWKAWIDPETTGATLYCPGIPGGGKTFILTMLVDQLQTIAAKHPDMAVAYVFCSYERPEDSEARLIKACLRMLLEQVPSALEATSESHRAIDRGISAYHGANHEPER